MGKAAGRKRARRELRVWSGAQLRPQVHVQRVAGAHPSPTTFVPVNTERFNARHMNQRLRQPAYGGLFTADMTEDGSSVFLDLLSFSSLNWPLETWSGDDQAVWRLIPDPGSRLIVIACPEDWDAFTHAYPLTPSGHYDFVRAAEDGWDGIHLTSTGAARCGIWGYAQTLWLRWAFQGPAQQIPPRTIRHSREFLWNGDIHRITWTPAWFIQADPHQLHAVAKIVRAWDRAGQPRGDQALPVGQSFLPAWYELLLVDWQWTSMADGGVLRRHTLRRDALEATSFPLLCEVWRQIAAFTEVEAYRAGAIDEHKRPTYLPTVRSA